MAKDGVMPVRLDFITKIDPNAVYDVLVKEAGASNSEHTRNNFVSCWNRDWDKWRFGGSLGHSGKCWRERRGFPGEGYVPHLRVDCDSEHYNKRMQAIIEKTNAALLEILISAGLRRRLTK